MRVKLKKLDENAKLPIKAKKDDFCYDVYAISEEEIAPNVWKYGLGFAYEIERPYCSLFTFDLGTTLTVKDMNISIDIRPRSSIWKTGMVLANSTGTCDEGYRNEVAAIFYHVIPTMPRYKVGDRVGQIKLGLTLPLEFEFVDEINENTERGKGGIGSTGNQ